MYVEFLSNLNHGHQLDIPRFMENINYLRPSHLNTSVFPLDNQLIDVEWRIGSDNACRQVGPSLYLNQC